MPKIDKYVLKLLRAKETVSHKTQEKFGMSPMTGAFQCSSMVDEVLRQHPLVNPAGDNMLAMVQTSDEYHFNGGKDACEFIGLCKKSGSVTLTMQYPSRDEERPGIARRTVEVLRSFECQGRTFGIVLRGQDAHGNPAMEAVKKHWKESGDGRELSQLSEHEFERICDAMCAQCGEGIGNPLQTRFQLLDLTACLETAFTMTARVPKRSPQGGDVAPIPPAVENELRELINQGSAVFMNLDALSDANVVESADGFSAVLYDGEICKVSVDATSLAIEGKKEAGFSNVKFKHDLPPGHAQQLGALLAKTQTPPPTGMVSAAKSNSSTEIEKKFLVKSTSFKEQATKTEKISQGYLSDRKECTIRVRIAGNEAWLTIKGLKVGLEAPEFEYAISVGAAEEMLRAFCPMQIVKTRFTVPVDSAEFTVDEFDGTNKGLILAEVEYKSVQDASEHAQKLAASPPAWLGDDVSEDSRYFNSKLLKNPYGEWGRSDSAIGP